MNNQPLHIKLCMNLVQIYTYYTKNSSISFAADPKIIDETKALYRKIDSKKNPRAKGIFLG